MENTFIKLEKPFLLLTEDVKGFISYSWWDDEKLMQKEAVTRMKDGENIVLAIEIPLYRNIDIPIGAMYSYNDFLEEICSAYDVAVEQGLDNIVLVIDTDIGDTYYINDTKKGFQCDKFDFYFDDLEAIAEALYYEEMIMENPIEIRIE